MVWMSMLVGCVAAQAEAPVPPVPPVPTAQPATPAQPVQVVQWEYALLVPARDGGEINLAIEVDTGPTLPSGGADDRSELDFVKANGQDRAFHSVAAALDYAGAQGWEIVAFIGHGEYLAKRRK